MLFKTTHHDLSGIVRQLADNELTVGVPDRLQTPCKKEREIICYGAHFKGWCQAFGKHKNILVDNNVTCWLIGENQVGLVLTHPQIRQLNREILLHEKVPTLIFDRQGVHIGVFFFPFANEHERQVLRTIEHLLETGAVLHLFRTSHSRYGNGRRIITISNKRPPPIIYRKIDNMNLRLQ